MEILEIEETGSTNSWLAERAPEMEKPMLVFARRQTAGRGQRGNSWEAEPGKNLSASLLLFPSGIEAASQFVISEAVALAVCDVLAGLGVETSVKWPNDIYAGDGKICGILIEHTIMGRDIVRTIAGVGININQTRFLSSAPNPVSVVGITGKQFRVESVAELLAGAVERRLSSASLGPDALHSEFMERLWRGDGRFHPFLDRLTGERIEARIEDVAPSGILSLRDSAGLLRRYAFKEVEFILGSGS